MSGRGPRPRNSGSGPNGANEDKDLNLKAKISNGAQMVKALLRQNDEKSMCEKIQTLHSLV